MLSEMLQDDTGFIARDWVDGALLVTPIKGMCNRDFSARGINKLLSPLDIKISCVSYVKPRAEAPCLYGTCHILGEIISVESMFSWSDLKRMAAMVPGCSGYGSRWKTTLALVRG